MDSPYKDVKPTILIKNVLDQIHEPGEVFEVRIPKTKAGTLSGYFNDTAKAAIFIGKENGKHQSIYATVNPVQPSLLARMENKIAISQVTTTDAEIERRRWFLLDFDPVRPTGISSTDGELENARVRALELAEWLTTIGWPKPMQGCSGNGWHLMYRIDMPNDDAARIDVEYATKMLSSIFSDQKVSVDVSVFNASRVWKIYGTLSMKGSSTEERPHRVAQLTSIPDPIEIVTREQIENVARPLRDAKSDEFKDMTGEFIADMVKWLADRGQTVVSGPRPMFGNEGQKWTISSCPFDHNHKEPMVGLVNHRPIFRCLHNSCSAYRWKEFREKIDPTYKDPDVIFARLKEWCDGDSDDIDPELIQSASATGKKLAGIIKTLKKECTRARVIFLEDLLKTERRRFLRETIGENNEKGNIVGIINRVRSLQAEGIVPMYWIADFDHRIRIGPVGDVECPRSCEADEISLMIKFHSAGDSWVKQTHAGQVIKHLAEEYRCNPLRAYLKAKKWDGVKRLDDWLPHYMGTADNAYTRAIGRKWLISAAARGIDPGCQADHMLIFEGKQGIGKSRAARILGGQFYTEYSGHLRGPNGKKDMVSAIIGKLIVEMSELATMRRADAESLKATLTTTVDDERLAYERDTRAYPRTSVFLGTTNEQGTPYIADASGARRFWPTIVGECGPVRTDLLQQDVDQLWAEAVEAYDNGEDWYTVPREEVAEEQAARQISVENSEPWFEKIRYSMTDPDAFGLVWHMVPEYANGVPTGNSLVRLGSIGAILGITLGIDTARQTSVDTARVLRCLKEIGFEKKRPNKSWQGNTYCYDLKSHAIEHMWSAVEAASKATRFPKEVDHDN